MAEKLTLASHNTHPAKQKDKLTQQSLILKTLDDLDSAFTSATATMLTNASVAQNKLHALAEATLFQGVEEILGQNPDDDGSDGSDRSGHKHRHKHRPKHDPRHDHGHKHGRGR